MTTTTAPHAAGAAPHWARWSLVLLGLFCVWWRGHTFGPTIAERTGLVLWPVVRGETEPLDCDEAAYGYIGRRLAAGAVMYRDLSENKPPLGYWIFALAVALGGASEFTIRLLPLPFAVGTMLLVNRIGRSLAGPAAGLLAAFLAVLLGTDPYLYGNGAQLEQVINFFAVASLSLMIDPPRPGVSSWRALAAGACVGAASLVRQVAGFHLVVYGLAALASRTGRRITVRQILALGAGFTATWAVAAAVLWAQGGLREAAVDVLQYGRALATDTPADPSAPPFLIRWVTGNADPRGVLPWPFGETDYLVWWGRGTWPLWLAGLAGVAWLAAGGKGREGCLVAAWTGSALVQVALPGLFWAHYYLMPTPGLALGTATLAAHAWRLWSARARNLDRFAGVALGLLTAAAILGTLGLQVRDYLLVPPEQLTIRYKGGQQWITLRALGRDLAQRTRGWRDRGLLVWGWQSPLFFYSGLDGVTPHFFVDPLLKSHAQGRHPLIRPRLERILLDLDRNPPAIIFAGDPPFPGLAEFLRRGYVPSPLVPRTADGRGLWVEADRFAAFATALPPPRKKGLRRTGP